MSEKYTTEKNRATKRDMHGFTIIELIIVILVIGILTLLVVTTYSGIQQKARDSKRQKAIKSLQFQLEGFYSSNGYYPSLGDINQTANGQKNFLATNLKNLDRNSLIDPLNKSNSTLLSATATAALAAKQYAYTVTVDGSASCEADHTTCAKYVLTANLESSLNGQSTFVKTNLN